MHIQHGDHRGSVRDSFCGRSVLDSCILTEDEAFARFKHLAEMLRDRPLGVIPAIDYTAEYFRLRPELFGV